MTEEYILVDKQPVLEPDSRKWAEWFQSAERHVGLYREGDVTVSTVFLGLDHNFTHDGPPVLFETMAFGGPHDQDQERYCTWEEAEQGHQRWVERVKGEPNAKETD